MKKYRPTSAGVRYKTTEDFSNLEKKPLPRSLLSSKTSTAGRNTHGHITSWQKGGGHKQQYRKVDFVRSNNIGIKAKVEGFYYDPNRNCRLVLLNYFNGSKGLIIAPAGLSKGDIVESGPDADIKPGNALPLANIPVGTIIHNVEVKLGSGGQFARAAGTSALLVGKEGKDAQVKLQSGELRLISQQCYATIGAVGNAEFENRIIGTAGRARWLGRRPVVRGVAMNPVDHPLGGGEGKSSGGRHPVSPWGQPTKGYKTRKNKRTNSRIVRGRPRGKMTRGKG